MPKYYPPLIKTIDWENYFINGHKPDALDIGCGKGLFLMTFALQNSKSNVLGLEIRINAVRWIESIIKGENIGNCSALWYCVANGLPFIENDSVNSVFYLFPDPWPKKKHHKRRAFNEDFLKEVHRVMKSDGTLYLASDVDEVHEYHLSTLNKSGMFDFEVLEKDFDWGLPTTNKEKFCLLNKIPYYRILCKKKSG